MTRLSAFSFWALIAALLLLFGLALALGGIDSPLDRQVLIAAQIDGLVPAARIATEFGSWAALLVLGGAGSVWLFAAGRRRAALALLALVVTERTFVELLKALFDRARPDPIGHLVATHSTAFPSGHAANGMTLGLGLALIAAPPRWRRWAIALGLAYALAIGLSRPILGVHWPSDVVGGWTLGAVWTLLLVRLARPDEPSPES